ncbi:aromatic acid exporter family protein [Anaerobacillus alkaliphilus]|uniref:Aromatic acid exporter family protein n=1 Tax=Anaerobacillus alkaliphilus TaxID=1548597 RepID=A0A4Q0VP66_9BACI|nr:aromatic acid exporter family protein [Anaerobacillus alkaliphilus]RXI98163.1 aromatic acid exporter family protein [Anaerobacillus alkaliphilus]
MNPFKFVGRRIIKTGIAVFITALICSKLGLPVIFAVITAIVTTEPTAADSLKRGIIRLPAAAVGAGFALLFDLILGQGALTFALVSMLTILLCHHLKLDNGTLVATLTAVAMIPGANEGIITEFLFRLSGTSLGIIISTLVNFAVLPPRFGPLLVSKVNELFENTALHSEELISAISKSTSANVNSSFRKLHQDLEKAFQLCQYQEDEWQYRKRDELEDRSFQFLQRKLTKLQKLISHVGNLSYVNLNAGLSSAEKKLLMSSAQLITQYCTESTIKNDQQLSEYKEDIFHLLKKEIQSNSNYGQKETLFYELLGILDCLSQLQKATEEERVFSENNKNYPAYIFAEKVQYD